VIFWPPSGTVTCWYMGLLRDLSCSVRCREKF
jgi:hypothetical protein